MKTKIDISLEEVWEMKENLLKDFKNSKFDNFKDFIEDDGSFPNFS